MKDFEFSLQTSLSIVLKTKSPLNKHQLLALLKEGGVHGITTSDINRVLYSNRHVFAHDGQSLPMWRLKNGSLVFNDLQSMFTRIKVNLQLYKGHQPREWQLEAVNNWIAQGRRGVVEAVTGTGKSIVGMLAAADALARGLKVLIIVPGIELQQQWTTLIKRNLPSVKAGGFGNGLNDSFYGVDVMVSTIQSASKYQMLPNESQGLLIADEVHGYGTAHYARAFESHFAERLGMTATYERLDNGLDLYVTPFFAPDEADGKSKTVIAGCDYARGLHDNILAPFRVGLIGVSFTDAEAERYEQLEKSLSKKRADLIYLYECAPEPFGEFIRDVQRLSEGGQNNHAATRCARNYLQQFKERKDVLANCQYKTRSFRHFIPMIHRDDVQCLVFTSFIETAKELANMLNNEAVPAVAFTSELTKEERKVSMEEFKSGGIKALVAPKVLDEGVDVPEADVGIILSANHSRRQMIQRMGRIIRPKKDGGAAAFFIVYVKDSSEDPARGAHESFLTEIMDLAIEVRHFENSCDAAEILDWYIDGKMFR